MAIEEVVMEDDYRIEGGVDMVDTYQGADAEKVMEFEERYLKIMRIVDSLKNRKGIKFKDVLREKRRESENS